MSFRLKIFIAILGAQLLLLVPMAAVGLRFVERTAVKIGTDQAIASAHLLARTLAEHLQFFDLARIDEALRAVVDDPAVMSASVFSADGDVLAQDGAPHPEQPGEVWNETVREALKQGQTVHRQIADTQLLLLPIESSSGLIGALELHADNSAMAAAVSNARQLTLKSAAIALAAALTLSWLLSRRLSRRLADLKRAAEDFGSGHLESRVEVSGNDEFADLARAFNTMAAQIKTDFIAIAHAERRLADTIAAADVGTWEWNVQTDEFVVSHRWAAMIGSAIEGIEPITFDAFRSRLHPDDDAALSGPLDACFRRKTDMFEAETRIRHQDGHWLWILSRGRVVSWTSEGEPERIYGIHLDVTEKVEAKRALADALRQAEAASAAKSQFLSVMSHELRTPLNGVLGMSSLLRERVVGPEKQRMLDVIHASGAQLLAALTDVLDFVSMEDGALALDATAFDPAAPARRAAAAQVDAALAKGVAIELHVDPVAQRIGDVRRVGQILDNLVSNAVKFTDAGTVSIVVSENANQLVYTVRDTGIGMTDPQLAHLFEPFAQADGSATRRFGGTGLGMAVVRRLVDAMGGNITVDTHPGEGTLVRVALSVPVAPEGPAAVYAGVRALAIGGTRPDNVILGALLRRLGVEARMAGTGDDAIRALRAAPVDVLLVDVTVRDLAAILTRIRTLETATGSPRSPVIAITSQRIPTTPDFDVCVPAPVSMDPLRDALAQVLRPNSPEAMSA